MPVVGHHAVTEQLNLKLRHYVDEDTFKRLAVRIWFAPFFDFQLFYSATVQK
jgi:hypothetical protein